MQLEIAIRTLESALDVLTTLMDSIVKDVPKDFSAMPLQSSDQVILQVASHVNATLLVQILMIKHNYQFVTG